MQQLAVLLSLPIIGLIPAAIARAKGRKFFPWWLYGSILGLFDLIHALAMAGPGDPRWHIAAAPGDSEG